MAIEKIKILGAVLELPVNCTANSAHLAHFCSNGWDWQCCFASSSKMTPRILIFSIAMGAENLSCVKSFETHARTFLPLNISAISSVLTYINVDVSKTNCTVSYKTSID